MNNDSHVQCEDCGKCRASEREEWCAACDYWDCEGGPDCKDNPLSVIPAEAIEAAPLYRKFNVERLNDITGKHVECRYFVLDPQHDSLARVALEAYAAAAREAGIIPLADDIDSWLGEA